MIAPYPSTRALRDRFVLERRGERLPREPFKQPRVVVEPERDARGQIVDVATLFLTGRECPWRCVMCDLWRHASPEDTAPGAIPLQIRRAVAGLESRHPRGRPSHAKLYNAGSLFDPRAVPPDDDGPIAQAISGFKHVVVESHPRLIGPRTWRFQDRLARQRAASGPSLEVAMGLETAHPEALERLHKGITLDDFGSAAAALAGHGIALRAFVLVHPPFVPLEEQAIWLARSVDTALACGASVISLIPTRGGNGAMEALAELGLFQRPTVMHLEHAAANSLRRARGRARVFADTWDLSLFSTCAACLDARRARLNRQNLEQQVPPPVSCEVCGATTPA